MKKNFVSKSTLLSICLVLVFSVILSMTAAAGSPPTGPGGGLAPGWSDEFDVEDNTVPNDQFPGEGVEVPDATIPQDQFPSQDIDNADKTPQTGDGNMMLLIILLGVSMLGISVSAIGTGVAIKTKRPIK